MSYKSETARLNDRLIDTRVDVIRNAIVLNVRFLSRKYVVRSYSCAYLFVSALGDILEFMTMLNFMFPAERASSCRFVEILRKENSAWLG